MIRRLRGKILLSLALGAAVLLGLGLYADLPKLIHTLARFETRLIPPVLGLTVFNYALRFVKWHYYLRVVGIRSLSVRRSLLVFLSGFSMTVTPGKVGEWLKSFLLKEETGTPVSVTAPIIIAERISDGLAMVILAAAGLILYGYGWQALVIALVLALAFVAVSQYRPLANAILGLCARLPIVGPRVQQLEQFYESANQLLSWRNLGLAVGIGVVPWSAEGVAFYLVLLALGVAATPLLLVQAISILAASTILGALSMLPGGLAVAEGSIAGLLLLLGVTTDTSVAAAATLAIRLGTLWFGVSLGVVALLVVAGRLPGEAGGSWTAGDGQRSPSGEASLVATERPSDSGS
jgi:glycosyltransferase 2 family protein